RTSTDRHFGLRPRSARKPHESDTHSCEPGISPAMGYTRARTGRGFLQRETGRSVRRLQRRRGIRHLRAAACAPHGEAPAGEAGRRAAEHGGGGESEVGELALPGGAAGWERVRDDWP